MPVESYEDDDEEQEGPRSSFGTYLAEGDALFKQSEYKKALESYSLALELQQNDKTCLVARSKCYLKLGDPQKALQDAEDALTEDKEFNKGLYRKAEALYCMGDFEYALMYYHRGHKLRPELDEFRLGIQKAQEAIDNSIGSAAKIKLENKGDLSFFTKQDDLGSKKRGGYMKPTARGNVNKMKQLANRNKEVKPAAPSKKTVKQLLGELYSDKEYFEKLMEDEDFIKSPQNNPIYELVQGGLSYLETRTEFWRQQKPLYARKKEKGNIKPIGRKKTKPSISQYVLKQLEDIDQAFSTGDMDRSLRLAQKLLKYVSGLNNKDLPNKTEVIANIHSCIGNAYIEMDQLAKALKHHEKDLSLSKESNLVDGKSRALDNVGRVYARQGNFKKAVESWNEKLPLVKAPFESTWLFHEIGRCHLELGNHQKAGEFGQKSLVAGKDCEDPIWQLNATVLIAQSQVKLSQVDAAIETFSSALELAVGLSDLTAQSAISKALNDLQRRSSASAADSRNDDFQSEEEGSPRITSDMKNNLADENSDRPEVDSSLVGSRGSNHKDSSHEEDNSSSSRNESRTEERHGSYDVTTHDDQMMDDGYVNKADDDLPVHVDLSQQGEKSVDEDDIYGDTPKDNHADMENKTDENTEHVVLNTAEHIEADQQSGENQGEDDSRATDEVTVDEPTRDIETDNKATLRNLSEEEATPRDTTEDDVTPRSGTDEEVTAHDTTEDEAIPRDTSEEETTAPDTTEDEVTPRIESEEEAPRSKSRDSIGEEGISDSHTVEAVLSEKADEVEKGEDDSASEVVEKSDNTDEELVLHDGSGDGVEPVGNAEEVPLSEKLSTDATSTEELGTEIVSNENVTSYDASISQDISIDVATISASHGIHTDISRDVITEYMSEDKPTESVTHVTEDISGDISTDVSLGVSTVDASRDISDISRDISVEDLPRDTSMETITSLSVDTGNVTSHETMNTENVSSINTMDTSNVTSRDTINTDNLSSHDIINTENAQETISTEEINSAEVSTEAVTAQDEVAPREEEETGEESEVIPDLSTKEEIPQVLRSADEESARKETDEKASDNKSDTGGIVVDGSGNTGGSNDKIAAEQTGSSEIKL